MYMYMYKFYNYLDSALVKSNSNPKSNSFFEGDGTYSPIISLSPNFYIFILNKE